MKSRILFLICLVGIINCSLAQQTDSSKPESSQITELPIVTVTQDRNIQSKVLSKIVIQTRGINNSQELLTMVPGLFIGQHAGGGKAEQIFLRGFDIDHGTDVHISVDGVPVNMVSHAHGQGYADLHFVIPELVENIQFNKGPYYADKGDFATAGYVSLNTKNTLPLSSLKIEGGQFGTLRGVSMMNVLSERTRKRGKSLFVAGEAMRTRGYFDHPQNFDRINLYGRSQLQLGSQNTLNLTASYFKSSWDASGQIPQRAVDNGMISFYGSIDPDEGGETKRSSLNAVLTTNFTNGGNMRNQVYIADYDFELYSNFTFFKNDTINGDQIRQKENRLLSGYNGSINFIHFIGNAKIYSEAGVNLRSDITTNSELSHTLKRTTLLNRMMLGDINQLNSAAYIKESITLSKRLNIIAGLRLDNFHFNYSDVITGKDVSMSSKMVGSPKISIAYQLMNNAQLYLNAGKGFHSNDARVSVYNNAREVIPPVYGLDLGLIWKPDDNLYINPALWFLKVNDELVYVGDDGIVESSGKTRRWGVDLTTRFHASRKLFFDMDLNYAHARSIEAEPGQNYVPLAPAFTSSGGVVYKMNNGFSSGLRYKWMEKRPANESYSVTAEGYFISEVMLSYLKKNFECRITASNILNTKWKETQFDTESRLKGEPAPVSEIHFTPGSPLFIKAGFTWFIKY